MMNTRIFVIILSLMLFACNLTCKRDNPIPPDEETVTLKQIWKVPLRATASTFPPAYSEGIVYTLVGSDGLMALKAKTGELVWQLEGSSYSGSRNLSRIFIRDDYLYTYLETYIYCFNKFNGAEIFKVRVTEIRVCIPDDIHLYVTAYVAGTKSILVAVDKNTGQEKWRYQLSGKLQESPGIDGDYLYAAIGGLNEQEGSIFKLNRFNGEEIYTIRVKKPEDTIGPWGPTESPVFYDSLVIVEAGGPYESSKDGIYAFHKETAEFVWHYDGFQGAIRYAPSVYDGVVYVATQQPPAMLAINAGDGSEVWKSNAVRGSCIKGPVAIYKDFVILNSSDAYTYCFSRQTGDVLHKIKDLWDPIAVNDTLLCGGYEDPYDSSTNFFAAYQIIVK